MKKRLLALLMLVTLTVGLLAGCAPKQSEGTANEENATAATEEKKVFRVGMECSYAPFNWTQSDDSNGAVPIMDSSDYAYGYDVEMAKRIAQANDWELEVYKIDWDGLILALNANKIDAIIAGMGVTEERQKTVDFSEYYWSGDMVMIVRADSEYADAKSIEEFRGAKVTSQLNTVWMDLIPQIPEVDEQPGLGGNSEILVAVRSGKLDGTILGETEAYSAALANPDLKVTKFETGKGFDYSKGEASNAVAVRKGDAEVLEAVNVVLSDISSEERSALMEKIITLQPVAE